MQYRKFGKLDWNVSALGFGAMRLPVQGDNSSLPHLLNSNVDEQEAIKMIRYAVDKGVNYLDTAYPYHAGKSEVVVGKALEDGYREKIKLATKMPTWEINKYEDFDRFLNDQLDRLQTDHLDFYLLHGLNKSRWPVLQDLGVLKWAEEKIASGQLLYLGFSFHDDLDTFKEIVDAYDNWALGQIQYNFMDTEYQAGTEGLRYASQRGLAVVIMEPLRGGQLTKEPPDSVKEIWERAPVKRSPADWALQWNWNQPEVSVVLSGMSSMQHVIENIASAERSEIGSLSDDELAILVQVSEEYRKLCPIPCTRCGYCIPCPNGVDIPNVFTQYNDAMMYDDPRTSRFRYGMTMAEENRADNCIECLECEEKCPQEIAITEWVKKCHAFLMPGNEK
ncbi:MAG: aldo/keto reductase [Desulfobacteraceae bacterium]|nr:MAG: aldo/keto reductase [Desulfobacteraceae bacterium]